ncbi:hypothetical protein HNO88_000945 [Novosphingobium chloroacetimidivorans]|uniref:Uncharacterized protein n=1 Tax=Novosphingobium chloroacetimidivorans TaxID=1428314 RepID=A0A7W7K8H2_9SPHN|nr:lipopolysaccharide assembly protein LapA domain-containing protein [Novosphingobium chloroacetimidivorans]MBB4857634.1 hypothetical protein [Novosphingobium chloroacetimidivorans]
MLKLIFLLAIVMATGTVLVLLVMSRRNRHRRRLSRARREGDYAERQSQWRKYLSIDQSGPERRNTDQGDGK